MQVIADLTVQSFREIGLPPLPGYEARLLQACIECPLLFGTQWYGDRFREVSLKKSWFIDSLASNTAKEAEGSIRIWEMASRTEDATIREHLRQHALDEARHGRYYISMIGLAFPGHLSEANRDRLQRLIPTYTEKDFPDDQPAKTPAEGILDELIQMNIGEIRTRIHQLLVRPILLAYCPEENRPRLTKLLDAILGDETRHVAYTARLIETAVEAGEGDWVTEIMRLRWKQFNEITKAEMEQNVFD